MKVRVKDSGKIVDVKYEYADNVWRVAVIFADALIAELKYIE